MFEGEFLREEIENGVPTGKVIFTVADFLKIGYGAALGQEIYDKLHKAAAHIQQHEDIDGKPGICFTDDGGMFVSLGD